MNDKCCYCGAKLTKYNRNNADDYSDDFIRKYPNGASCCSVCNDTIVLPRRIINMYRRKEET